jgi:HK97 family phage portal protein
MLFELDRATWSNSEQMGKEFLSYSLAPWLRAVESALNRALFTPEERKLGYRVAFDEDDLTRADFGARSTAYSSAISARWLSPNDVRKYEGLPPYPGGHEYVNPNTGSSQPGANDNKPPKAIDDKPALPAA